MTAAAVAPEVPADAGALLDVLGVPGWLRPDLPALAALAADPALSDAWHLDGLCAYDGDPDAWYPEKGRNARYARQVCGGCPVRLRCLVEAARADERFGVWGGATTSELADVRVALGMARPSADDVACANGHEWTDETTGWTPGGKRKCRECNRIAKRDERRRARAQQRAGVAAVDGRRRAWGTT